MRLRPKLVRYLSAFTTLTVLVLPNTLLGDEELDESLYQLANRAISTGLSKLGNLGLKSLDGVEIQASAQRNEKPVFSIEAIKPISLTETDTYFWQGRIASSSNDETVNLGLGYRYLTPSKSWMFGINAFADQKLHHSHNRAGLGAEVFGEYFTFRANYYNAYSGKKTIKIESSISTTEEALDGWDAELETPLPYFPWASLNIKTFEWNRETIDNLSGSSGGLRLHIAEGLEIEAGVTDDNFSPKSEFIKLTWQLNTHEDAVLRPTLMNGFLADQALTPRDLESHRLEKVRRQNDVIVEKRTGGGVGLAVGRRS